MQVRTDTRHRRILIAHASYALCLCSLPLFVRSDAARRSARARHCSQVRHRTHLRRSCRRRRPGAQSVRHCFSRSERGAAHSALAAHVRQELRRVERGRTILYDEHGPFGRGAGVLFGVWEDGRRAAANVRIAGGGIERCDGEASERSVQRVQYVVSFTFNRSYTSYSPRTTSRLVHRRLHRIHLRLHERRNLLTREDAQLRIDLRRERPKRRRLDRRRRYVANVADLAL